MTDRRAQFGRAFSLIELLVVIAIVIILAAAVLPLISGLTKSNNLQQGVNIASVMLANGRNMAMSTRRQVAVVFYEETSANAMPFNANQTAIGLAIESSTQTGAAAGNTIFEVVRGRGVEYMPTGVRVATLDDASTQVKLTEQSNAARRVRAVVFDENGQMLLRNGLSVNTPSGGAGTPTQVVGDWGFVDAATGNPSDAAASPAILVFDGRAFADAAPADDAAIATWMEQNATVLIVNAYTGNVIR